ncbi:hypothetical protein ONZ45_g16027 [Pleurotus djamor]|nr:hypothetical protein ONZ45_g16027 [Pleurotus djamor]
MSDGPFTTIWSAVYGPNTSIALPSHSILLTNVAYAGIPEAGRNSIAITYVTAAGSQCTAYLGSLIAGTIEQFTLNVPMVYFNGRISLVVNQGPSSICLTGYYLVNPASGLQGTFPAHDLRQQSTGQVLSAEPQSHQIKQETPTNVQLHLGHESPVSRSQDNPSPNTPISTKSSGSVLSFPQTHWDNPSPATSL